MYGPKLLTGEIVEPVDTEILQGELERLEHRIIERKQALKELEGMIQVTSVKLRTLYIALHGFFGDVQPIESTQQSAPTNQPHSPAAWTAWKQQLPPACGKVIDALMVQPLTSTQLKSMCKVSYETVRQALLTLGRNGLIEKDGDLNRLKRI